MQDEKFLKINSTENSKTLKVVENTKPVVSPAKIKIFGVGGAGCNAVNKMTNTDYKGVDLFILNTDKQILDLSNTKNKIQIGKKKTKGLGAGGNISVGEEAARESEQEIIKALEDTDMLFITAGMGGGTGTGAAPVIAEIAKNMNITTVAVVTKPFAFELGRKKIAEKGIEQLKKNVDSILIIDNNKLLSFIDKNTPILQAFDVVDNILINGIKGITDIITETGIINNDFADISAVIRSSGTLVMGIGQASGVDRYKNAVQQAMNSDLLEHNLNGAKNVLINICSRNITLSEVTSIMDEINTIVSDNPRIFVGISSNQKDDDLTVTIIATGFEIGNKNQEQIIGTPLKPILKEESILPKLNYDVDIPEFLKIDFTKHNFKNDKK